MSLRTVTYALSALVSLGVIVLMAAETPLPDLRAAAEKQFTDGNWRDAFETYERLCLDKQNAGQPLAEDFQKAIQSLRNLQQHQEVDGFRDAAVEAHPDDWRLLVAAAESYRNGANYGFLVGGEFVRGNQRGGGQYVMSQQRDRVLGLRLMDRARQLLAKSDATPDEQAGFFNQLSEYVLWTRAGGDAWRLQDLTDLSELPDYEEGNRFGWGRGWGPVSQDKGAPVDENGDPVFHTIPESWEAATSDGQRWRWCLEQVATLVPSRRDEVDYRFAQFLRSQFGVQTMQQWGLLLSREADDKEDESGPFAVHTLKETETIARLATGVKRFTLPDEFNFIRIYQRIAKSSDQGYAEPSLSELAQIFEDRQQYPKAAKTWQESIRRFKDVNNVKQPRLEQIVGNWGRFEPVKTQPARTGATVDFRFRNGKRVDFTAHRIKVDQLIGDVMQYLKSRPRQIDWQQVQIDDLGYRLVTQNEQKYLGDKVADWSLDLDPRSEHFDRRITVTTPLTKAGAYLVVGKMADGNTSRIIVWVNDTAIVKKPLDGKSLYYVADAVTGKPVAGANVEFFGWRQEHVANTQRNFRILTKNFAERTDGEGEIVTDPKLMSPDYQWLAIARTNDGRFAHLGFSNIWFGTWQHSTFDQSKAIVITDRPVYRPEQKVEFKIWLREADYTLGDVSRFADKDFTIKINDPQGTEVYAEKLHTDEYGGLVGEYTLPDEAKLGSYSLYIEAQHGIGGSGTFRVEEYKKPEFEVTVEAPTEPIALGETIKATIRAKYYFGAPVTKATVKYKVERSPHEQRWYPHRPWDWLYGEGYWWFTPDYAWYKGFGRWGCFAPRPFWQQWSPDPPELVLDREVEIGPDGTVEVEIDTALAKALHGDQDHKYAITAEVVDASRRTIVGQGNVLVAREPFKVFVWTDRGHYRVGDTIHASFNARTLDSKGVEGKGSLKLLKVTYDETGEPIENVAQEWELDTDADGRAEIDIKASAGGQYRLAYSVTDADGHTIEGGYLFVIRGDGFDGSEFQFNDLELIADKAEYKPGETVNLLINTNRVGSTVLLFVRPEGGIYAGPPQVLRLDGKSTVATVEVAQGDMPNFFIEAMTVAGGDVHTIVQQIVVPPEKRVLNVEVQPDADDYLPGAAANVTLKLTDVDGKPFVGSMVMSIYDRAVEYISGGSNVPEIREFFWKWTRNHHPQTEHNLERWVGNLLKQGETAMGNLGVFGEIVTEMAEVVAAFGGGGGGRPVEFFGRCDA